MRHARTLRGGLTVLLGTALLAGSAGCTHNYYYGTAPVGCPPATVTTPAGVQYGSVCEVPTQTVGGGTVIASNPASTPPALTGPRPPRIVLSEPPGSGPSWRRSDPDGGLATTRVSVGDDATTTTK